MLKPFKWALAATFVASVLLGCGGGGSDAGSSRFTSANPTTPPSGSAVVSALIVEAPETVLNGGDGLVPVTITAVDSSRRVMAAVPLEFVGLDETVINTQSGQAVTGTDGTYKTTMRVLGSSRANRILSLDVRSGNVSGKRSVLVTGSTISGSSTQSELVEGQSAQIDFVLRDSSAKPIVGADYEIKNNAGVVVASGKTGGPSGEFRYVFTPGVNTAGQTISFTAYASGVSRVISLPVRATAVEPGPVSLVGIELNLQANPISVGVNRDGSEDNRVTVKATAKDANGNPTPNVRVMFKLEGDTIKEGRFALGGDVISGSTIAYTSSSGDVETSYIPGPTPTSTQALSIVACFGSTVAQAQQCATKRTQNITVTGAAVSVFLGSDGLVGSDDQLYVRNFVVQVVDASGKAMPNVRVAADLNTLDYRKGFYSRPAGATDWSTTVSSVVNGQVVTQDFYTVCSKEDLDDDDQLDVSTGEDVNHSGFLEPRRAAASISFVQNGNTTSGSEFTNASGLVFLRLAYPKSVATWMSVELTATAIVANSEGRDVKKEVLRALIDDIKNAGAPAFVYSPFGLITEPRVYGKSKFPDGTNAPTSEIGPCLNPD